jgi:hypothetical protein
MYIHTARTNLGINKPIVELELKLFPEKTLTIGLAKRVGARIIEIKFRDCFEGI